MTNSKFAQLPLSKHWLPIVVVSVLLTVVSGLVGTLEWVRNGEFGFDQFLNATGNGLADAIASAAGEVYSPKFAVILTLAIMVAIWLFKKSRLDALAFGAVIAAGWLPAEVFKLAFNEPRPDQSLLNHMVVQREVDAAFPSGHLCFAIAIGYGLFLLARNTRLERIVLVLWLISLPLMGWARMYVGVHYFNDLLGSLFSSITGLTLFALLWNGWLSGVLGKLRFFQSK